MTQAAKNAAAYIKKQCPAIKPKVGIILGSGLSAITKALSNVRIIPYTNIPSFPSCTVKGHKGKLHMGYFHNTPIACCEGRIHFYEGVSSEVIKTFIRTLKLIGCQILLITNAAGSLNRDVPIGNLVLIKDHINFQNNNPLTGPNDSEFGPRFIDMGDAYDIELRQELLKIAQGNHIPLTEGIFAGVLGPSFETCAEINMLKNMGVDVVAMSLIPEVIVARHCDIRVVAISAISNLATGLHTEKLSHQITLHGAQIASQHLTQLISKFFKTSSVMKKDL